MVIMEVEKKASQTGWLLSAIRILSSPTQILGLGSPDSQNQRAEAELKSNTGVDLLV